MLVGAAIFFTAGAALAPAGSWLSGMGWGKVASTLVAKVGLKGTLGNILSGALAGSGWGAAIEGGISAATGGSFVEGARRGALHGAVTGGLAAAAGWTPGGKPGSQSGQTRTYPIDPASPSGVLDAGGSQLPTPKPPNPILQGLKRADKWVEKNPLVAGSVITGVGGGIGAAAAASSQAEQAEAERQAIDDRLAQISANYRVGREALGLPPLGAPAAQVAVPDVTQAASVDPLRVPNAGTMLSQTGDDILQRSRVNPNGLLAQGLMR